MVFFRTDLFFRFFRPGHPVVSVLSVLLLLLCLFQNGSRPRVASASTSSPVDLRTLIIKSDQPGVRIPVPLTKAFERSRRMVFHFLGTPKFFVGVIVQSFDKKGSLLHHGLFDQGPIDEVLSRHLFGHDERVQILGIFLENGQYFLHLKRIATGKTILLSLDSALATLTRGIGTHPDLVWAVR